MIDRLIARFNAARSDQGYPVIGDWLIDAIVPPVPMHRNYQAKKSAIEQDHPPGASQTRPDKLRRKDRNARWAMKCAELKVISALTARRSGQSLPERIARANAKRSVIRSAVKHVFAGQKHRMGLIVRTFGIARARIKIGMANLTYNFQRLAWLKGRIAPA